MAGPAVALLNPCYWPEVRRGSERLVHDLAGGLRDAGWRPRILTSHPGPPSRRVEEGVPVLRAPRPPDRLLRRRGHGPHRAHLPLAAALLAVGRDDLAHAFYATDAVVGARWARRTGRPAVFTYAGLPERATLAGRRDGIAIAVDATRGSTVVVTLSRAARDALWRWLRVESEIIAPGVDLDAFSPGGGRSPAPRLLCPAALGEPRKRGDLLLAAFARVRRRRPDATLVLQRPRDPAAAAALQREDGVVLAGLDDHAALVREYRAAWVTVLASRAEAFGLVVAESLACGTPAVAAADGGAADIVADEDVGRTFAGEDPEALAAAIEAALELAAAPETGAACRARAADFSQDRATAAHLALYQRLLRA